jgi:hypothetical protein
MMRAMGSLHSGHVVLEVLPSGTSLNGGVETRLTMHFDVLPGSSLPATVVCTSNYPCGTCGSFWGHVFNGLYGLDVMIGQTYENKKLWES